MTSIHFLIMAFLFKFTIENSEMLMKQMMVWRNQLTFLTVQNLTIVRLEISTH